MFGNEERALLLTRSATFIALIAAGAWISIPFFPVPLTLQTFFVLMAGVAMRRHAVLPAGGYLLLGALGLPVFHNGLAGIGVLFGPTGGYLLGFIPAAAVAGIAYEHPGPAVRLGGLACASALILGCGSCWLANTASLSLWSAFLAGTVPFLLGDTVKTVAAYFIGKHLK
ncbi:MAG: biotin transporter BioY [Methanomicrobiales archaeon]|nr:biotin transporter BioY [Methanomicrobiales archaeon]